MNFDLEKGKIVKEVESASGDVVFQYLQTEKVELSETLNDENDDK